MMRYLERMENTARLVDAGLRMSLTRSRSPASEWESVLTTSGALAAYKEKHDDFHIEPVVDFLTSDPANPGSIYNSICSVRENARMTRTALTREGWEAINETWMDLKSALSNDVHRSDLPDLLSKIMRQGALVRGTLNATMLRNAIFWFASLGTLIERSDNTARILDTKYYVLLPSSASVGSSLDLVQWEMILRCASAERSFHWLHGGEITPAAIVDFMIHDIRLPRSIAYCYDEIITSLAGLEAEYESRTSAHDLADANEAHISASSSEVIIGSGLHEFLIDFLERNRKFAAQIEADYRFYE